MRAELDVPVEWAGRSVAGSGAGVGLAKILAKGANAPSGYKAQVCS